MCCCIECAPCSHYQTCLCGWLSPIEAGADLFMVAQLADDLRVSTDAAAHFLALRLADIRPNSTMLVCCVHVQCHKDRGGEAGSTARCMYSDPEALLCMHTYEIVGFLFGSLKLRSSAAESWKCADLAHL